MKKFFTFFILFSALFFFAGNSFAQCTPDPDCIDVGGDGEFCPTEFPNAVEDEYYEQTLTVIAPVEQEGFTLHHIEVLDIGNIPPGMSYQCQDNDCSFYPATPKCINIFGTPAIGSWGSYNLQITIEIFINILGNPVSIGEFTDSSSEVFIEPQLYGDFIIDDGISDFLCIGSMYTITYTGNASSEANYNWNFGENATVLSGDGQGPYEIIWEDATPIVDSISLFVEEGDYTSPEFKENFAVDICEGLVDQSKLEIRIIPNPFTEYIDISGLQSDAFVHVYDLSAKELISQEVNSNNRRIDLSRLNSGIYLISIITPTETKTQKIVKR